MKEKIEKSINVKAHGSVRSYTIGFIISIILTLCAYIPVVIHMNSYHEMLSHVFLIPYVLIIAVVQLIVQLLFFLHLGQERGPRWNLVVFISTLSIVLIIIAGSLWIMGHLNYNMTPRQINQYVQGQDGF